jgi:Domain of unknown function (DUF6265)
MRKILTITALMMLGISASAQDITKTKVTDLSWISGCWELNDNGRVTTERWAKATENLMLGTSQTVRGTKSVAFEYLRIVNNGQELVYVAQPSNAKEPTSFTAKTVAANEVVFENLKHDFPQRIIYKQTAPDKLAARIEGPMNGKETAMDFPMVRVKCD